MLKVLLCGMGYRIPKSFDSVVASWSPDCVISMGCDVSCPLFPGASFADWELPDPAGESMDIMRKVRDDIEARVKHFVESI